MEIQKSKNPRFLTPAEVAEILRCHVKTVRAEIKAGRLKAAQVGRAFIIDTVDLEAFIKSRTVKAHG